VIDPLEVPKDLHSQRERGRLQTPGHHTGDDSRCTLLSTLLIINEADGSWVIHGLGAPSVRLTRDVMISVAQAILRVAR
jgi:hypothetical protein